MPRYAKPRFKLIEKRFEAILRRAGRPDQRWPYEHREAAINIAEGHLVRYADEEGADAEVVEKVKGQQRVIWPDLGRPESAE